MSCYEWEAGPHNHLFDYDWPMHSRQAVRNDPAHANADSLHHDAEGTPP